ncbi:MAG: hypothetical protein U0168_21560 [Nannocystaceae bacterium]
MQKDGITLGLRRSGVAHRRGPGRALRRADAGAFEIRGDILVTVLRDGG